MFSRHGSADTGPRGRVWGGKLWSSLFNVDSVAGNKSRGNGVFGGPPRRIHYLLCTVVIIIAFTECAVLYIPGLPRASQPLSGF